MFLCHRNVHPFFCSADSLPIPHDMMNIYFSASPGLLASIDDFYVIHGNVANLAVTETSLDVYNDNLINLITPTTMLCWARYGNYFCNKSIL